MWKSAKKQRHSFRQFREQVVAETQLKIMVI